MKVTKSRNFKTLLYKIPSFKVSVAQERPTFQYLSQCWEGKNDAVGGYSIVKSEMMPRKKD